LGSSSPLLRQVRCRLPFERPPWILCRYLGTHLPLQIRGLIKPRAEVRWDMQACVGYSVSAMESIGMRLVSRSAEGLIGYSPLFEDRRRTTSTSVSCSTARTRASSESGVS